MRKRLRKKKKLGEFVEWGALLKAKVTLTSQDALDAFLDEFVERIESLGCYCGGGVSFDRGLDMVVELGRDKQKSLSKLKDLEVWLNDHSALTDVQVLGTKHGGKDERVFDLWHEEPLDVEL